MKTVYEIVQSFGNNCLTCSTHANEDEARIEWNKNDCSLFDNYRLFLRVYRPEGGIAYEQTVAGYNC
jgi:hypothetical protein